MFECGADPHRICHICSMYVRVRVVSYVAHFYSSFFFAVWVHLFILNFSIILLRLFLVALFVKRSSISQKITSNCFYVCTGIKQYCCTIAPSTIHSTIKIRMLYAIVISAQCTFFFLSSSSFVKCALTCVFHFLCTEKS